MSFLERSERVSIAIRCISAYNALVEAGKLPDERKALTLVDRHVFFYNSPSSKNLPPEKRFAELQYHYGHGKKFYRVKVNRTTVVIYNADTGHRTGINRATFEH